MARASNGEGIAIAKQFLMSKIEGQNAVLKKYGLRPLDIDARHKIGNIQFESLESARKKLVLIESHNAKLYFNQIFKLFPEKIRPEKRTGYKACDRVNNVFNFAYYVLKCRVHKTFEAYARFNSTLIIIILLLKKKNVTSSKSCSQNF
jgi:CRISPR/Cas system-associated endonuclease Cas1